MRWHAVSGLYVLFMCLLIIPIFFSRQHAGSAVLIFCFCPSVHHVVVLYLNECMYFRLSGMGVILGYWHQRADRRYGNPPQGNQELLVVRDKVGRPPGQLGVSKSMECDIFSLQCFDTVGWVTGRASSL